MKFESLKEMHEYTIKQRAIKEQVETKKPVPKTKGATNAAQKRYKPKSN